MEELIQRTGPASGRRRRAARSTGLRVGRTDIQFWNLDSERVCIEVQVVNQSHAASKPAVLSLESAPLGAFVPWSPLTKLDVPALRPGGVIRVGTTVWQPTAEPVFSRSSVSGLIPRELLTATGGGESRRNRNSLLSQFLARTLRVDIGQLAPDLLALDRGQVPSWAGNINVHLGGRAVERHMARALRATPGRTNLAMFLLGGGADYSIRFEGNSGEWTLGMSDMLRGRWMPYEGKPIPFSAGPGSHPMMLAFRPPEFAITGSLEVHVLRELDGRKAIVEFDLDAKSLGPGCYTV